tara:strand:- start:2051 stop:2242 length:192 start_codon:yes stop_codon:yes gene_type:complete
MIKSMKIDLHKDKKSLDYKISNCSVLGITDAVKSLRIARIHIEAAIEEIEHHSELANGDMYHG